MPKGVPRVDNPLALSRVTNSRAGKNPAQLVALARTHTLSALHRIIDLMNGKGGKMKVMNSDGQTVEIDVEVPAAVQARCAEIILDRGYGKAPQAILMSTDEGKALGVQALPIAERILAIKAARERAGETTDLEASEITEVTTVTPATAGADLI